MHRTRAVRRTARPRLRSGTDAATPHRKLVEEHAADVGSVWQVETWQGASLLVVYSVTNDIVDTMRMAEQLETASRTVPSLKPYVRAARASLLLARGEVSDRSFLDRVCSDHILLAPRQNTGWARLKANVARGHNMRGEHQEAKRICEEALELVTDADRDYAAHFTPLELELATADAALGRFEEAFARIDALLARFRDCDHPVILGIIHATRAHVAHAANDASAFERSLAEAERWFVPTGSPALVAQCKRLRELRDGGPHRSSLAQDLLEASQTTIVNTIADQSGTVTLALSDEKGQRRKLGSGQLG